MRVPRSLDEARLLAARGELSAALEALDALLAADPGHVPALLLRGGVLLQAREEEAALRHYERAAELRPRSAEALDGLARCLHLLGRDEQALAVARQARQLLGEGDNSTQTAPVFLTLVLCLRGLRRFPEALEEAEEGLRRCADAVLAQWASVVEEELAEAERERC